MVGWHSFPLCELEYFWMIRHGWFIHAWFNCDCVCAWHYISFFLWFCFVLLQRVCSGLFFMPLIFHIKQLFIPVLLIRLISVNILPCHVLQSTFNCGHVAFSFAKAKDFSVWLALIFHGSFFFGGSQNPLGTSTIYPCQRNNGLTWSYSDYPFFYCTIDVMIKFEQYLAARRYQKLYWQLNQTWCSTFNIP